MNKKDKIKEIKEIKEINIETLENLIIEFKSNEDKDIRYWIIKRLSSTDYEHLISFYDSIVKNDYPERIRKEAVSALGRKRDKNIAKKYLSDYLNDSNPEIVLQAIRGLLVFKKDEKIEEILKDLYKSTPNEIIQYVISKEYSLEKLDFDTKESHIKVNDLYKNKVINGDVLKVLENMENNSIHLTFTSPPYYNARDYSIYQSYDEYLNFLERTFKEIHRITKDGRYLAINTSPMIIPRVGRKYSSKRYPIPYDLHNILVQNGWEFIDDIHWVKPDASVKNRIGGFSQHRKPLMYKPNGVSEQIMVYRKRSNKLTDWIFNAYPKDILEDSLVNETYERTNVWEIDPVFDKKHTAVFPYKLCDNIVKYYSFKGDLVFDPFAGSGTLAKAALDRERSIFMTEISEEYFERIKEKLNPYFDFEIKYLTLDEFINL